MDALRHLPPATPDGAWLYLSLHLHAPEQAWLADPRLAAHVAYSILEGQDRGHYHLSAWCILPDRIHLLLQPHAPLPRTLHWFRTLTTRHANAILKLDGRPFWHNQPRDHYPRDRRECDALAACIVHAPVAAGLAAAPHLYQWSSARLAHAATMSVR